MDFFSEDKLNSLLDSKNVDLENYYDEIFNCIGIDRMKYVRNSFKQGMKVSDKDWLVRPIIQNKLDKNIDELFKEK